MDAREVWKNDSAASCWVVIHGKVYDVTNYLSDHPGGPSVLLKWAGKVCMPLSALYVVEDHEILILLHIPGRHCRLLQNTLTLNG